MKRRAQFYREGGWESYDPSAPAYTVKQKDEELNRDRRNLP
jgi:hypothetical protein